MAKKKQIELTIEEKLQNALVPKEEQPYKIPSNWCWSYWKYIAEIFSAKRIHKSDWKEEGIPFYRAREIVKLSQDGYVNNEIFISNEKYLEIKRISRLPKAGDLMVSGVGTIGASYVVNKNDKFYYKDASVLCVSGYNKINAKYLNFYLKSPYMINEMKKGSKGTTVDTLTINKFNNYLIVLPPINEQQRIVNIIESLFTKLDRAKELIENTLAQFEQNKMAILHKAFIGELTAKWRKENNIDLSSWQEKTIDELCTSLKYGTSKKSKPEGSVVVLRMGNLQNGEIDWSNLMYTDDKDDIEKYLLKKGDVLFNRTNSPELVGKTSIYRGEYPAIYAGYLIKLDYGKDIIGEYLNYMMNSTKAKHYCYTVKTDGVSQSNINAKKIGAFEIPVPTIEEQQEIVNILDNLLAKYNKIKNLEQQLEKIELLKKAILAKAFRGELGTNNPDEESAENLLKEILAEK